MKKDGGPAFPLLHKAISGNDRFNLVGPPGMSLRDWFAAHAPPMTDQWLADSVADNPREHITDTIAAWNFRYADAMLKEREKE